MINFISIKIFKKISFEISSKSNIADRYFDNGDVMFQFNSFFLRENFLKSKIVVVVNTFPTTTNWH